MLLHICNVIPNVYDPTNVDINGSKVQNIMALCYGDANGSYLPSNSRKSSSNVFLASNEKISLLNNGEFEIPFKVNKAVNKLSSVTLEINYPFEWFDVKSIRMIAHNEDLYYSVKGGIINVIYSTLNSLDLKEGDLSMTIRFGLKKDAFQSVFQDDHLEFSGTGEFGDFFDKVIEEVTLTYASLIDMALFNDYWENDIKVYPNPARDKLTITNVEDSRISVNDMLGRNLMTVDCKSSPMELDIRKLLPGTYILKINKSNAIFFRKFIVVK